jgi:hypothetical protein
MTSHAQPLDAQAGRKASRKRSRKPDSAGAAKRKADGEGASLSVAKIGLIGTIGAAIVAGIPSVIIAITLDNGSGGTTSAGQTFKPPLDKTSAQGSFDQVAINDSGTEVTVTGSAEKDVDSVVVLIGPRQSGGQYWANSANVVNGQWKLAIATEPHVPVPYEIKAYYRQREVGADYRQREGSGAIQDASYFAFKRTGPTPTPTPTPPGSIVSCAEQHGDSCFNGPGWGPPSVFQSDH